MMMYVRTRARGCVCVRVCIFVNKHRVIFQLIVFTGMAMLIQINDTKQPVFYFVVN